MSDDGSRNYLNSSRYKKGYTGMTCTKSGETESNHGASNGWIAIDIGTT